MGVESSHKSFLHVHFIDFIMSYKKILVVILLAMILTFEIIDGWLWPKKAMTHPQLDNAGKWWHYFKAHPVGKMYNLFHESKALGLTLEDYSLTVQPSVAQYEFKNL